MPSFSLFAFSYPQTLRESLASWPATTVPAKLSFLRSRCKETLLTEGTKDIDRIRQLILDTRTGNYLVLYCNCGNGFVFSPDEQITETLLFKKERVVFRMFSGRELGLPEIMFYLFYRELDLSGITPLGRPRDSRTPRPVTRFDYSGPSV